MGKEVKVPSCSLADLQNAGPILITATINGQVRELGYAEPRVFSTGSYGYNLNGKSNLPLGNGIAKLQLSMNLTVVNSKDAGAEFKVNSTKANDTGHFSAAVDERREAIDEIGRLVNERDADRAIHGGERD